MFPYPPPLPPQSLNSFLPAFPCPIFLLRSICSQLPLLPLALNADLMPSAAHSSSQYVCVQSGTVRLAGRIAYCPQQPWIMNDTLRANILFGKEFEPEWWVGLQAQGLSRVFLPWQLSTGRT